MTSYFQDGGHDDVISRPPRMTSLAGCIIHYLIHGTFVLVKLTWNFWQ